MTEESIKKEEELITNYLEGCSIARVKNDIITFELFMYIDIETNIHIPNYRYLNFYWPEPEFPKRKKKLNELFPPPITNKHLYFYQNIRTGNIVRISYSSKKERDENNCPYTSLQITFKSGNGNVTKDDINSCLKFVQDYYHAHVKRTKKVDKNSIWGWKDCYPDNFFRCYPFHIYYTEPCIDFTGSEDSMDYLFDNLLENLYVSRFSEVITYGGNNKKNKKTWNGRVLRKEDKTKYIGDRIRLYRFTRYKKHYLRLEFRFDKQFLRSKDIWLLKEYDINFHPLDFWQKRCFFFMLDLQRIKKYVGKKHPEHVDKLKSFIVDKQYKADGTEYSNRDKLLAIRHYSVDGKKIFKTGKQYLTPKWYILYNFIAKGLSQLSFISTPTERITPEPASIEDNGKRSIEERIIEGRKQLNNMGLKATYKNMLMVTGIGSRSTLSDKKHLWQGSLISL